MFGVTFAPNQVPTVLKKRFSLEMIKNDICLGGKSKQNASFSGDVPQKTHPCSQCVEWALVNEL